MVVGMAAAVFVDPEAPDRVVAVEAGTPNRRLFLPAIESKRRIVG